MTDDNDNDGGDNDNDNNNDDDDDNDNNNTDDGILKGHAYRSTQQVNGWLPVWR